MLGTRNEAVNIHTAPAFMDLTVEKGDVKKIIASKVSPTKEKYGVLSSTEEKDLAWLRKQGNHP